MSILVSDAAAEESLQAYTSPLSLQAKALDDLSEKVLNGAVVSDGNNPFTFLTEFASNMTADIVTKACDCFNSLYPENAQTATELYKHLSDFDYVGLYATPANTTVELVLNRKFIIDNAVNVDTRSSDLDYDAKLVPGTYSKIIIPSYSRFTIGDYVFGLMYPIEIRVRKAFVNSELDYKNSVITVIWDTSYQNPLMPLETHILEHRDFEQDGVSLTAIEIPIYQFEVENHVENAIASTGFAKRYDYKDKFYAVRIFHFKNGRWNELEQTFSDTNYDVDIPTAIVKVLQDIGKVEVVIPHIYFNSNDIAARLGNRILVKLYTTKGEVNVDLSEYQLDQFTASFLLTDTNLVEDDTFSNMLKRIPTVFILPLSTRISSGTNGITFQQLKDRVKYSNSYTVKITPSDLENYFHTSGYKFTKELDNITDRVYCAHKVLTDKTGTPIASGEGKIIISTSMIDDEAYKNTISKVDDETFTINTCALYKYNEDEDTFTLLTDQEKSALLSTDLQTKVDTFNNNLYTYSPFHVVVAHSKSNPISGVFDMYNPVLRSVMFEWENDSTTAEISIYRTKLETLVEDDKLTGYALYVSLFKTNNIEAVKSKEENKQNIRVLLTTETSNGLLAHMYGEYVGIDEDGKDLFVFNITSDFRIDENGNMDLTSFTHELGESEQVFVPSSAHQYIISFFMDDEVLSDNTQENVSKSNSFSFAVPRDLEQYTMLCRQIFTLKLGDALPLLHGNITISTTDAVFKTYPTTQFATYSTPVYGRWSLDDYDDATTDEQRKQILKKLGTVKFDKINGLSIKHAAGDVIVSSPYSNAHGPVISVSFGDNIIESLELEDVTASSSMDNVWTSEAISGEIYVESSDYPEFTGVYHKEENGLSWEYENKVYRELFDESVFDVIDGSFTSADLSNYAFYSSNTEEVKTRIKGIKLSRSIETEARGLKRKWFLLRKPDAGRIENDPFDFDFEKYTGYVIEYSPVADLTDPYIDDFGLIKNWKLNQYVEHTYSDDEPITEDTGIHYSDVYEVVDASNSLIPVDSIVSDSCVSTIENDPYTHQIQSLYYILAYAVRDENREYHLLNNYSDDGTDNQDREIYLVLYHESVSQPVYIAKCANYYGESSIVARKASPWNVSWSAVEANKKPPYISLLNYGSDPDIAYTLEHSDGLLFMIKQAQIIGQQNILGLYRAFDHGKIISNVESEYSYVPPFVVVLGTNKMNQDVNNENLDEENKIGYSDATGGLYYFDYEASVYDYEKDGLTARQIDFIFGEWYNESVTSKSEEACYDSVLIKFNNEYGINKLSIATLRKIVSSSNPSYYFPYKKIVSCGTTDISPMNALIAYSNKVLESGNRGLVSYITRNEKTCYFNLLTGLSINPETSAWEDVDRWPWEYVTPWICLGDYEVYNQSLTDGTTVPFIAIEGDVTGKERDDFSIVYNSAISGTKILHGTSDLILDENGNPIIDENGNRELVYGIDTIQCDYKLRLSEDAEYVNYLDSIRDLIRSYLYELKSITPSLLARTKLYFTPIRTFGNAEFKGSCSESRMLPTQCSVELGLHIESYVHNSVTRKRIIRDEVIELILKDIKDGVINLAVLAKTIMKELSDEVVFVDVLGINGDKTLQTLIPVRDDCYPQLKQILVLHDDGTIHADRDLTLDWYVIN